MFSSHIPRFPSSHYATATINYKGKDTAAMKAAIEETCPKGVDVYFDNVGGDIADAALLNMNTYGRISMCGAISGYNDAKPDPGPRNNWLFITRQLKAEGFIGKLLSRVQRGVVCLFVCVCVEET